MMKPTDLFRDQVNALWSCFKDWNECEQTLVLYSLLKGVSGTQAKFLSMVLEQAQAESDLQHVEREANDPDFVRSLNHESKDDALVQVLSHLPLLQPSSTEAKAEYLKLIPEILNYTQEKGVLLEEAHQLFTYLVIHPVLSCEERLPHSKWISQFEDQPSSFPSASYPGSLTSDQLVSPFPKPSPYAPPQLPDGPSRGFLVPGSCHDWYSGGSSTEGSGGGGLLAGPSSFHQPLTTTMSAPPAVNASGSSDDGFHGKGKRNSFLEENSGMKDVPAWLKSLRLHKYTSLFEKLDYKEMMMLTEKQLEEMDVTKGARNKIMLSIQKLKERQQVLRNLEKDIMSSGSAKNLRNALNDIKNMLITPIRAIDPEELRSSSSSSSGTSGGSKSLEESGPNPAGVVGDMRPDSSLSSSDTEQGSQPVAEGDLPGQITRFMGKMCTQLLMSPRPHEEIITQYLQLLDKCYNHEAFTAAQKSKLLSWRKNCQKFSPHPYTRKASLDSKQQRNWSHYPTAFREHTTPSSGVAVGVRRPVGGQPYGQMTQPHLNPLLSMNNLCSTSPVYRQTPGSNMYLHHRQSLGGNAHSMVQRTKSAPNRRSSQPTPPTYSPQHPPLTRVETPLHSLGEPDITDRLERLCRSVTEHALGDEAEHNGDLTRH
ncbi:protein Smaug homolog 1-like [Diadema setosum]|uniref:protein Smaug homolog 1-like n=1 Tax=Diadema setosum TaxID=31175 RepID=UPI003B3A4A89